MKGNRRSGRSPVSGMARRSSCSALLCLIWIGVCGCGEAEVVGTSRLQGWLILDSELNSLDLKTGRVRTLAPYVRSILRRKDDGKTVQYSPSPQGRYLVCWTDDGEVWVVDFKTESCRRMARPPGTYVSLGPIAWSPSGSRLACLGHKSEYDPALSETQGLAVLFLASIEDDRWTELRDLGSLVEPYGMRAMTEYAWMDESTLLVSSGGQVKSYNTQTGRVRSYAAGHRPIALGPDLYACDSERWGIFVLRAAEKETQLTDRRGIAIDHAPAVSPDRRYLLFVNAVFRTVWPITDVVCWTIAVYDMREQRFQSLFQGRGISYQVGRCVARASWIEDRYGLRERLKDL